MNLDKIPLERQRPPRWWATPLGAGAGACIIWPMIETSPEWMRMSFAAVVGSIAAANMVAYSCVQFSRAVVEIHRNWISVVLLHGQLVQLKATEIKKRSPIVATAATARNDGQ